MLLRAEIGHRAGCLSARGQIDGEIAGLGAFEIGEQRAEGVGSDSVEGIIVAPQARAKAESVQPQCCSFLAAWRQASPPRRIRRRGQESIVLWRNLHRDVPKPSA
jgi:hypothetical protein